MKHDYARVIQSKPDQQSLLSGYGVQLTVKNTEYKAIDDTQVEGSMWVGCHC